MKLIIALKDFVLAIFLGTVGVFLIRCLSTDMQVALFERLQEIFNVGPGPKPTKYHD